MSGRTLSFIATHWAWALLAPVLMLVGTTLHESAHALGALLAGGTVEGLVLLPSLGVNGLIFGRTEWSGIAEGPAADLAKSSPFILAHLHAALGALVSARFPGRVGRVVFFTSSLLPMVDVSMLHAGLFLGSRSADLARLSPPAALAAGLALPLLGGLGFLSWRAFRRNWPPPQGLSGFAFAVLLFTLLAAPWLRFALGATR